MDLPLISHPDVDENDAYPSSQLTDDGALRLAAHNRTVGDRAVRLFGPDDDRTQYLRIAASLHDFGKVTPQFQAHVRPAENYDGPDDEKVHARLGALATWYVLEETDAPPRDQLAATLAVARHHQALPNAAQYTGETLARAVEASADVLQAQINRIDETWPEAADDLFRCTGSDGSSWAEFAEWARSGAAAAALQDCSVRKTLTDVEPTPSRLPDSLYDRTIHYWAALTLADKSHAMGLSEERVFDFDTLDLETLERHINTLRQQEASSLHEAQLNDERERARRQALRGTHEWLNQEQTDIATLTLPTGLGKTFTGLSAAFEARDILDETDTEHPDNPRPVIYALPYTSIIEQTRALFEDPELWGADPKKSALTVHHYLSETVVYGDEYDAADVDESDAGETAQFLGETWRDGTILTTFVQLFESLTGPSNRQGLKLPSLDSALIILDEPQALPKDWWDGIERLLQLLTGEYGAKVIAMTATQPSLFREMGTSSLLELGAAHAQTDCSHCRRQPAYETELPPTSQESYFNEADRVRYTIDESALSHRLETEEKFVEYDLAASRIHETAAQADSVLAICNTIESSRQLTQAVSQHSDAVHLGPVLESILTAPDANVAESDMEPGEIVSEILQTIGIEGQLSDEPPVGGQDISSPQGPFVLTLNSRYRPFDRQVIIQLAEQLSTGPVPFILVSTQAIEAGVDISFERVYRDIAPLDSIVQAAGRCNRAYEWGKNGGQVTIWTLAPTGTDASNPPAYWVYERGSTDAGIPDHLRLISDVLDKVPGQRDIADIHLSKHAVDRYFEQLSRRSLDDGSIREHIDHAEGRWLSQQSLIGGYETADVLVAVSESESQTLDRITQMFIDGNPRAYDRLDDLSHLRVSLPAKIIDESPKLTRIDGQGRSDDGVNVFRFNGTSGLTYNLEDGGLRATEETIQERFTI